MTGLHAQDGARASRLCFGCMQFGGTADLWTSQAMFNACRAAHINFFDTAHTYTSGASERFLGQFIAQDRKALIIATKVGYTGGTGRNTILQQFDESRTRLGLDMIDILYLHRWDPQTALHETFETLANLQQSGKIRHVGVSNFAAWQVMKAQAVATDLGTRIDILQPMYSLVKRQAEVEIFPMALCERMHVAAYSPLGSGLLTGKYLSGGSGRLSTDERYAARYKQDWMMATAARLSQRATDMSVDPATLAVAWAAHHPAVSAPIIGARDVAQLAPSLDALKLKLTAAEYASIQVLSQQPAPATDRLEETTS